MEVIAEGKKEEPKVETPKMTLSSSHEARNQWKKAYIGEVVHSGASYNIQTHMEIKGFFLVIIILLGANKCILEEMEEGII